MITGGSTGLGYALARELVVEGARVAILARDAERLAAAALSLKEGGGDVLALSGDVRRVGDIERFLDASLSRFGRLDGVVNNAGTLSAGEFESHEDRVWDDDLSL
jgi:NAD(P)-dependent dehydrogenase (short-subunit alcohol dehydrogenase family)